MKTLILSLALLAILIPVHGLPARCNLTVEDADGCAKKFMMIGNEEIRLPRSDDEVIHWCDTLYEGVQCLRRYARLCLDQFTRQILIMIAADAKAQGDERCKTEDARKELLEHLSCFIPEEKMMPLHLCMEKYVAQMEVMIALDKKQRIPAACCSFHMFAGCVKSKLLQICDKPETLKYMEEMTEKIVC